jgi:acetyl-CoA carboxylase alpha subunit
MGDEEKGLTEAQIADQRISESKRRAQRTPEEVKKELEDKLLKRHDQIQVHKAPNSDMSSRNSYSSPNVSNPDPWLETHRGEIGKPIKKAR